MEPDAQAIQEPQDAPQSIDDFLGSALDDNGVIAEPDPDDTDEIQAPEPDEGAPEVNDDPPPDEPEGDDTDIDEGGDPDKTVISPPQSMSAKDREAFYQLPPESQQWIADRAQEQEAAFTKKTMELAEQRKSFDALEKVIAPRRQQLAMDGMDEGTAVGQLFALSDFANSDPVGFVRHLFNARNIPLSALTESGGGQPSTDPQTVALQQKLQGVEQILHQQQQAQNEQALTGIQSTIEAFSKNPEYAHYADLEADMIPIVKALRQENPGQSHDVYLAKAYKMAMAANDEVSAKVEADKKAKADAEQLKKAKEVAAKARKAGGTNLRTTGALPPGAAKAKTEDEFIGALIDERATA